MKNEREYEFCLFYSKNLSLENLCTTKKNIRTLIIIGQRDVTSLDAISELTQLKELWIVECGIKKVPSLKKNCELESLYLYSNDLECIPNLKACLRLKTISLSGNNIRDIRNLKKLTWIKELNLADNKLNRIYKIFSKKFELHSINLAGNYLHCLKDVKNLAALQKLNSVAFGDPLYGECPLVALCNYRSFVIHSLPRITLLDHYSISEEERHNVDNLFKNL